MKINGWQRIGILVSVIWMVGAYFYTMDRVQTDDIQMAANVDEACIAAKQQEQKVCDNEMYAEVIRALPREREEAAIVALVPVPLSWSFVYLTLFLLRWIKRGFAI
jgi:hypothetical protein